MVNNFIKILNEIISFVFIAGKQPSKMITYTPCFDLKCKCKWQIPFQIQLSPPKGVCLCATDRATRSDVKVSVLFPRLGLFFPCLWQLCNPCEDFSPTKPGRKSISLGSWQAFPYPAVATPTPHNPPPTFSPFFFCLFMATCENAAKVLRGQGEDACSFKLKMLPMMMSLQWNNLIQ